MYHYVATRRPAPSIRLPCARALVHPMGTTHEHTLYFRPGTLTEWLGASHVGKTRLLRHLVCHALVTPATAMDAPARQAPPWVRPVFIIDNHGGVRNGDLNDALGRLIGVHAPDRVKDVMQHCHVFHCHDAEGFLQTLRHVIHRIQHLPRTTATTGTTATTWWPCPPLVCIDHVDAFLWFVAYEAFAASSPAPATATVQTVSGNSQAYQADMLRLLARVKASLHCTLVVTRTPMFGRGARLADASAVACLSSSTDTPPAPTGYYGGDMGFGWKGLVDGQFWLRAWRHDKVVLSHAYNQHGKDPLSVPVYFSLGRL